MSTTFRREAALSLIRFGIALFIFILTSAGVALAKGPELPTLNECGNDVDESGVGLGFNGYYAPGNWTVLNAPGNGAVNFTAPASVTIVGSNGISGTNILTVIETTVVVDGTFSFNWSWSTTDIPMFDPGFYQIGGTVFQLTNNTGGTTQSGSLSFTATAGTVIRFGVNSVDGCCGAATLNITAFGWPAACPLNECGNYVDENDQGSDFFGYYNHANWSSNLNGGNGSVNNSSNQSVIITGNNNSTSGIKTTYLATAPVGGTVTFSWSWTTADSPGFDPGFVLVNGVQTNLTNSSSTSQSGTFSFAVTQGMVFGFGIDATDGCCGAGTMTITNFTWPGQCNFGCTIPTACNYDPTANVDDGSCIQSGCIDNTACNFDPAAGCDDGSCSYPGCTSPGACNYHAGAGCDNGSCIFPGCTDPLACNFVVTAGCDDGSCSYPGCTDPGACNFDPAAGCPAPATCTYPGCTNPAACNFDPAAGCNNGTCVIPPANDVCENATPLLSGTYTGFSTLNTCQDTPITVEVTAGSAQFPFSYTYTMYNDVWYSFVATGGDVLISTAGGTVRPHIAVHDACGSTEPLFASKPVSAEPFASPTSNVVVIPCGSLTPGQTYYIRVGGNYFVDSNPTYTPLSGTYVFGFFNFPVPAGSIIDCTDQMACNYNPDAFCGDGLCQYPGCTDPAACNFSADAGCDDGTCFYPGCTDPSACNYDPLDPCKQEPCEYVDCFGECGGLGATTACGDCYAPVMLMDEYEFNYTGAEQVFLVPEGAVELEIEAYGAGADFGGGLGGMARGILYNPTMDTLWVYVGGEGLSGVGGFNGGGSATAPNRGGGGGSDVRAIPGDLNSRIIVAGGGGGRNEQAFPLLDNLGGDGGGLTGENGSVGSTGGDGASGGSQLLGGFGTFQSGSFGAGANAPANGGGGGGGWYGGGSQTESGGGGGSSYIGGVEFGSTQNGVNDFDGYVIIRVKSVFNTFDGCIPGCTDSEAVNYFAMANFDNGSCLYAGCTDPLATNYNSSATYNDNSCVYVTGCTYPDATNFNAAAILDNGTCTFDAPSSCLGDLNNDTVIGVTDLLIFLSVFGTTCE